MSNDKPHVKRRKVLLGLTAGGVAGASQMPKTWIKPVVDTAVIPAHAATTGGGDVPGGGTTPGSGPTPPPRTTPCENYRYRGTIELSHSYTTGMREGSLETFGSRLAGLVANEANAGIPAPTTTEGTTAPPTTEPPHVVTGDLCIVTRDCATIFDARLRYEYKLEEYHETSVAGVVGGFGVPFPITAGGFCTEDLIIQVHSADASGAKFTIGDYFMASDTLDPGSGCPAKPDSNKQCLAPD